MNEVEIVVKSTDKSGPGFDAPEKRAKQFSTTMGKVGTIAGGVLAANFAQAIGSRITSFFSGMIGEAEEAAKVSASTAQGIKTIGAESWTSADAVGALSERLSEQIGVDDELIQQSANLLLTFKNIKNEMGEGNDVFDRATKATQDLAAKGFGSAESTAKMLGKALNDPIKGMTALSRAGVTFTEQQKEQIRTLVETGDILGAQKIILTEIEAQVGGTAEATATDIDKMKTAWGNFKENLGNAVMPVVTGLANAFSGLFGWVNDLPPGLQTTAVAVAAIGAAALLLAPRIASTIEALGKMGLTADRVKGAFRGFGEFLGSTWGRSLAIAAGGAGLLGIRLAAAANDADRFVQNIDKSAGIDLGGRIATLNAELERQTALQGPNIGGWLYFTDAGKIAGDRVDALKGQIANLEQQQQLQTEASTREANALSDGTASAEAQTKAILELVEAHDEFYDIVLNARDSERGFQEALDEAAEAAKKNGETLDSNTEKGRANAEALDSIVRSAFAHIDSMAAEGASMEELGGFMETARGQFIELAIQMGLDATQANILADQLGLIPGDYRAYARVEGAAEAKGQVDALLQSLLDYNGTSVSATASVRYSGVPGMPFAHGGIRGAQGGGPRSNLTLVGEAGAELVDLPPGSHVFSNPDTQRMMAGWGGDTMPRELIVNVHFIGNTDSAFATAFMKLQRDGKIQIRASAVR